jgi:CDP-diacylglycerol pyrophosphatase
MRWRPIILVSVLVLVAVNFALRASDRGALRRIVIEDCVPHWLKARDPSPCVAIDTSGHEDKDVAILKDLVGVAQLLAIPTVEIAGIESRELRGPLAPDLFGAAWRARLFMEARLGRKPQGKLIARMLAICPAPLSCFNRIAQRGFGNRSPRRTSRPVLPSRQSDSLLLSSQRWLTAVWHTALAKSASHPRRLI